MRIGGPRSKALAVALLLVLGAGCKDSAGTDAAPADCGFPPVDRRADVSQVPEGFISDRAEVTKVQTRKGRIIVALAVELSVQRALDEYRRIVDMSEFQVLQEDNEGFEAELYLRRGQELAAIQIRRSTCEDESAVFLNMPTA